MSPRRRMACMTKFVAAFIPCLAASVLAEEGPAARRPPAATPMIEPARIEKLSGVWIEGPGYDISYGGTYDGCARRCLATARCLMLEYYRPEKKCNLYSAIRSRIKGGSSDVGIRTTSRPAG